MLLSLSTDRFSSNPPPKLLRVRPNSLILCERLTEMTLAAVLDVEQAVELESPAGEKEETTLQAELRKSEQTIMAMEA